MLNPTHPAYQLLPDFPPNKGSSWQDTPSDGVQEWDLLHKCVVDEAQLLAKTLKVIQLRSITLRQWEIDILQSAAQIHSDHLTACFSHEDNLIVPLMKTRINLDDILPDRRVLLIKANQLFLGFEHLQEGGSVTSLAFQIRSYVNTLSEHLNEVLQRCCPIFRAYFTPDDARHVLMKAIGKRTKNENGAIIYHIPQFMSSSQKARVHWSVRIVILRPALCYYKKHFIEPLKAVETNKPPSFVNHRKLSKRGLSSLSEGLSKRSLRNLTEGKTKSGTESQAKRQLRTKESSVSEVSFLQQ